MKALYKITPLLFLLFLSCLSDENKKAFNDIKNTAKGANSILKNAEKTKENIERLQKLTPLTNTQLKTWLPQEIRHLKRTGFSVGKSGFMNVASIEGTYKTEEPENPKDYSREELKKMRKSIKVTLVDGAGPTGSMAISSVSMAVKVGVEEESEYKHLKPVEVNGIKASQTYYKKRNNTQVMFVYDERFAVTVNSNNMDTEETWNYIKNLDLKKLTKISN